MPLKKKIITILLFILFLAEALSAQQKIVASIGDPAFKDWKGAVNIKSGIATVGINQTITYQYPEGKQYHIGFRNIREDVSDWSAFSGIEFEVFLKEEKNLQIDISLKVPKKDARQLIEETHANTSITGKGWHTVYLSWNTLDISEAQRLGVLRTIKEVNITPKSSIKGEIQIKNVQLKKAQHTALLSQIKGKAVKSGQNALYEVQVANTTNQTQAVQLSFQRYGWESMSAAINPSTLELKPGESKICKMQVSVPLTMPEGSREKQILRVTANGKEDTSLTFITASALSAPNILHTAARWQEIKNNVDKYQWAKKAQQEYEDIARRWVVPEVAAKLTNDNPNLGMQLFQTQEEFNLMAAGISYQLTGKEEYAQKIALFLRRLSDPQKGYPSTFRGCHQSFVQEGHFFQHIVMAYDMIRPAKVLSETDTQNLEKTLRLFIETVDKGQGSGAINNWLLSEITGAMYCALALQDWDLVEKIFNGPQGVVDHLKQGVMSDGWWYECTISYNVWCASEFSQIALALEPWGLDFKNTRYPIGTSKYYSLMPEFKEPGLYGMNFEKWGTVTKNSISIKDMWDAIPSFADYRGVMFGVNDAQENMVSGQPYELAYYLYKDPEYASIVNRGNKRDLLYGFGELPQTPSALQTKSAFADNMGIVLLRSQAQDRPAREQLQAAIHYGTFGGYHGHFDRTNLLHLSRYGRSFYNPEMIWYGYPSYMYKFYVQTSMSKNMVVVDQKMQEPVESFKTLFHTGKLMQAAVTETNARWSNPPYGGMQYDWAGGISFAEKAFQEGRSIEIPKNAPAYGAVTDYTEPVLQRRLMIMTDDYVVLADYIKAEKEHTFDWLFQMKGFSDLTAGTKTFLRHDSQMNSDPLGSAQFITDCSWWQTKGAAKASFETCWGKDCDNTGTLAPNSEEGELKINVTSAWPLENEIMAASAPEALDIQKQLSYKVSVDGKILTEAKTGAWILGQANIDLTLKDAKELTLETSFTGSKKSNIFWANARVVLADGKEIKVSELPMVLNNIIPNEYKGKDYYGGPVKIGGQEYTDNIASMTGNQEKPATIKIDLSGLKAVGFKAVLGCDFPLGNETPRRKTYAVRAKGKTARYLNIIEPFEKQSVIKEIQALDADHLKITLIDGRVQEITINNFEGEKGAAQIGIKESKNGKIIREEQTIKNN